MAHYSYEEEAEDEKLDSGDDHIDLVVPIRQKQVTHEGKV